MITRLANRGRSRSDRFSRFRSCRRPCFGRVLVLEILERRCVLSTFQVAGTTPIDLPVDPNIERQGTLQAQGASDLYRFQLDAQGLVTAKVHAQGFDTILALLDSDGRVLIQSEATSPTNLDDQIAQHLAAGQYYFRVTSHAGAGGYQLTTGFSQALSPFQPISEGAGSVAVALVDVNGDHHPDIVLPDQYNNQILINYGSGDGTFGPAVAVAVGGDPVAVAGGDFNGDGYPDVAVANQSTSTLSILLGGPHGPSQVFQEVPTAGGPASLAVGDIEGNGRLDLAVSNTNDGSIQIFHGNGDGTFVELSHIGGLANPSSLAVADFNQDGRLDLAVACADQGEVVVLTGDGHGRFVARQDLAVGPGCRAVVAGDFNGDRRVDLAASSDDDMVSIFLNGPAGFSGAWTRLATGELPYALAAADFHGDGRLDLAIGSFVSSQVSVYGGVGDGTFLAGPALSTGGGPIAIAVADVNGDGRPDMAVCNSNGLSVSILLNNGDGTFPTQPHSPPPASPADVTAVDINGDGLLDLVVPEFGRNEVAVLLGRGDGTFRRPKDIGVESGPYDTAIGDFTGDGIPDMAVVQYYTNEVSLLQGDGQGNFHLIESLPTGEGPFLIRTADLNGDGKLDLVVINYVANSLSLYYGQGNGRFSTSTNLAAGLSPSSLVITDLNHDGRPDLAVTNAASNDLWVFLNRGGGAFGTPTVYPAGALPWSVAAGDLNHDGFQDLVVADDVPGDESAITVFLGGPNGAFQAPLTIPAGDAPYPLAIADFNGDGLLDVVAGNDGSHDLSLLIGKGDGTFLPEIRLPGGLEPYGIAVGDFNRDGLPDVVTANDLSNDLTLTLNQPGNPLGSSSTIPLEDAAIPIVTADLNLDGINDMAIADPADGTVRVLIGMGDGTFKEGETIAVDEPTALVVGDFNGDHRADLAVAAASGNVFIFLGLGNGEFQQDSQYWVGDSPSAMVAGDFNGDGRAELAVADAASNQVSILENLSGGSFRRIETIPVGAEPVSIVAADLDGDGHLDLVTANRSSGDLSILWSTGGDTFQPATWKGAAMAPSDLAVGDFNGDGWPDLAVADETHDRVLVIMGIGRRGFAKAQSFPVESGPAHLVAKAADFGDNMDDLIVLDAEAEDVVVFLNWVNGSFQSRNAIKLAQRPAGLAVADFNLDRRPDLAVSSVLTSKPEVYLGRGDGAFFAPEATVPLPDPSTLLDYLNRDGAIDALTINKQGQVLYRSGIPGSAGEFQAPANVTAGTQLTSRDLVEVATGSGLIYAVLDLRQPLVTLARPTRHGVDLTSVNLPPGGVYTQLIPCDVDSDGLEDIVVLDTGSNQVLILRQDAQGQFHLDTQVIQVGLGPTDAAIADVNGDGWPDLIVANTFSNDISVVAGGPAGRFGTEIRLRAGLSPSDMVTLSDGSARTGRDEPAGVVTGVFGPSGLTDVVTIQRGSDRISVLKGTPSGDLADPSLATTYSTGIHPTMGVAASLGRNGLLDLAVLNEGSNDVSIFLNDGRGGFITMPRVDAGQEPTGLAVRDVTGDGIADLLISNRAGDLLLLIGNGNGTFRPFQQNNQGVNLAVGDLTGSGNADFVLSDQAQDQLSVLFQQQSSSFLQGPKEGLRAPGAVAVADMNRDGIADLVLADRGGNSVYVYLGLGAGRFASPERFYTGTSPSGITIADLNGDFLPDLVVANSGSNDLTILLGHTGSGGWTMVPGPRLSVGLGPVSTTVADVNSDGIPDIFCVNQLDNSVTLLPGLGGGFFDDVDTWVFRAGQSPVRAFVGRFSDSSATGLVIVNSTSNDLTYYPNLGSRPEAAIKSLGLRPVAGVMGDFNGDSYDDLVIANNGDSRISVFLGSSRGLVLGGTVVLAGDVHPTDLTLFFTKTSGLQFFVGTQSGTGVVPVSLSALLSSTGARAPGQGSPASPISTSTLVSSILLPSDTFELNGFENSALRVAQQNGGAESLSSQLGAVLGWATQTGIAAGLLSSDVPPAILSAYRSLNWLIDTLIQKDAGLVSDILPMGNDDMATVAVILSASGLLDAAPGETEEAIATLEREVREKPGDEAVLGSSIVPPALISDPNRFVWNVDYGLSHLSLAAGDAVMNPLAIESEWVGLAQGPEEPSGTTHLNPVNRGRNAREADLDRAENPLPSSPAGGDEAQLGSVESDALALSSEPVGENPSLLNAPALAGLLGMALMVAGWLHRESFRRFWLALMPKGLKPGRARHAKAKAGSRIGFRFNHRGSH